MKLERKSKRGRKDVKIGEHELALILPMLINHQFITQYTQWKWS